MRNDSRQAMQFRAEVLELGSCFLVLQMKSSSIRLIKSQFAHYNNQQILTHAYITFTMDGTCLTAIIAYWTQSQQMSNLSPFSRQRWPVIDISSQQITMTYHWTVVTPLLNYNRVHKGTSEFTEYMYTMSDRYIG